MVENTGYWETVLPKASKEPERRGSPGVGEKLVGRPGPMASDPIPQDPGDSASSGGDRDKKATETCNLWSPIGVVAFCEALGVQLTRSAGS